MKLYCIPMTCSFAVHVALREAGITPALTWVDRPTKKLEDGSDFKAISPLGLVPVVQLSDGSFLNEVVAVLTHVSGTQDLRQLQWLGFVATEVHKKLLASVFGSTSTDAVKEWARASAPPVLEVLEAHLESRDWLLGDAFSVADAYLGWALFSAPYGGISLNPYPSLKGYVERYRGRDSVKAAFAIEGPRFTDEQARGAGPKLAR